MENLLIAIDHREPLWLAVAFMFGYLARLAGQQPLVGFLLAGFFLNALGAEGGYFLDELADLGITLLLFTIGLKLRFRHLLKPEIWAVTLIHMLMSLLVLSGFILGLGAIGLALFDKLTWNTALIVSFALSFSSTVFVVKSLERTRESGSRHGRIAVGVLIVQDIAAVAFLAFSTGKPPSLWALALFGLVLLRKPLLAMLERVGHGELLVLMGFALALGGAELFELVNLKGDLGALVIGIILAGHPRSAELADSLLSFKELFLVGFFLSIGLAGIPTLDTVLVALLLLLLTPLKMALFFSLFTGFRLMASTSGYASLLLANYSEFGLIVSAIAASNGWIGHDWLLVIALALSFSFIAAAPLNSRATDIYNHFSRRLKSFESEQRLTEDQPVYLGEARIIVIGMGRIGTGAYDAMQNKMPGSVIGIDFDEVVVGNHIQQGRNVLTGNAANPEFWTRLSTDSSQIEYILLSMSNHQSQLEAIEYMREWDYEGRIAATAKYPKDYDELQQAGVDVAFNIYADAGAGFAELAHTKFHS